MPFLPLQVGSTAVVALVGRRRVWVANCGDSRAVLSRGGRAVQLTDDHKPDREDEAVSVQRGGVMGILSLMPSLPPSLLSPPPQARVVQAGGQVLNWNGHRVMGILAMSRAIGDHGLRPFVIPDPEVRGAARAQGGLSPSCLGSPGPLEPTALAPCLPPLPTCTQVTAPARSPPILLPPAHRSLHWPAAPRTTSCCWPAMDCGM